MFRPKDSQTRKLRGRGKKTNVTTDENRAVPFVRSLSIASSAGKKKKGKKKREKWKNQRLSETRARSICFPATSFRNINSRRGVPCAPAVFRPAEKKRDTNNQPSRGKRGLPLIFILPSDACACKSTSTRKEDSPRQIS